MNGPSRAEHFSLTEQTIRELLAAVETPPRRTPASPSQSEEESMPTAAVEGIEINYRIEGEGPETLVLVNGLADDLETWGYQVPAFVAAGYRVLIFDNRGIGRTSKPPGPYTTAMFASDTKALVDHLGITSFHLLGVSMGGMIAQEYAIAHPADLRSVTLACTYAAPGPFCSRMFNLWADMAAVMGVPAVMRDVTLWAFTTEFFETRSDELAEFETAMRFLDQPVPAYLAQLNSIQTHDATERLGAVQVPTLVLAGEGDILIPVELSRRLHSLVPGAAWATTRGGHACLWEHPDPFNNAVIEFLSSVSRS
jgi:3-oxoadipate enol-lactonase